MNVTSALIKLATAFITEVMQNLSSDEYPSGKDRSGRDYMQIEDTIERGNLSVSGKGGEIEVFVGNEKAPYTKLYEFGKEKYEITGKMSFEKKYWLGYNPPPPAPDWFFFTLVKHPKSEPKPFIKPVEKDFNPVLNKALTKDEMKKLLFEGKPKQEVWA